MSGARDHRRWRAELAAYLLGSLEADEAAALESHLESCERCRDELRWLQPAIDVLPETVAPLAPPPELRERLLADVRADVASEKAAAAPAAERRPAPAPLAARLRAFFLRPAVALTAIALVAAVAGGYALRGGGSGPTTFKSRSGAIQASLERKGDSGTMELTGLRQLPASDVYEAWVQRGQRLRPSSLFEARRNGSASTAIPHQLADADAVLVTVEPYGGSRQPTSRPIISVPLTS
jgi:anti-sigma-K factor RskA